MRSRDLIPAALVVVIAVTSADNDPRPARDVSGIRVPTCDNTDAPQFKCWLEANDG